MVNGRFQTTYSGLQAPTMVERAKRNHAPSATISSRELTIPGAPHCARQRGRLFVILACHCGSPAILLFKKQKQRDRVPLNLGVPVPIHHGLYSYGLYSYGLYSYGLGFRPNKPVAQPHRPFTEDSIARRVHGCMCTQVHVCVHAGMHVCMRA